MDFTFKSSNFVPTANQHTLGTKLCFCRLSFTCSQSQEQAPNHANQEYLVRSKKQKNKTKKKTVRSPTMPWSMPPDHDTTWTMPRYGGFCTAAEYHRVQQKELYIRRLLGKDQPKMTELPKVEPYYSRCLEEFKRMAKSTPTVQTKIKSKPKTSKRAQTYKKKRPSGSNVAPCAARNVTPKLKTAPKAPKPAHTTNQPKPSIPVIGHGFPPPNYRFELSIGRDVYVPPNYPSSSPIGQKIGNAIVVDSPEPKFCSQCMLKPCIVDAHFEELCDRNSESQVILCDPADITFRKLEAFFRRLIVKYFGAEHIKAMGGIPACARDKCCEMAYRDPSEWLEDTI